MKPGIEINRLSLVFDRVQFSNQQGAKMLMSGNVPMLNIPFKIGFVNMNWEVREGDSMPERINFEVLGELTDPDWKVRTRLNFFIGIEWNGHVSQFGGSTPFLLEEVYLGEESNFYIDSQEVNLTPTINRALVEMKESLFRTGSVRLIQGLKRMSQELIGSDLIPDLLEDLYYQITGDFRTELGIISLSASHDHEHFTQADEAPPYLFLKIPTADLVYFINHFNWPPIEVKGYELNLKSIEVVGPNKLIVNVNETTKNWDIVLNLNLELRENTIYPVVEDIQTSGLPLLQKALFNILKGLLINQIEKRPISVEHIYNEFKSNFEKKYPFIQIQPGFSPFMDSIEVDPETTEIMVHYIQMDPYLTA